MKTFTFNVLLLLCTLSGLTFADTFKFKSDPYPPYIIADQYNNFFGGTIEGNIIPILSSIVFIHYTGPWYPARSRRCTNHSRALSSNAPALRSKSMRLS